MKLIVLSDAFQLKQFKLACGDAGGVTIVCDRPAFLSVLQVAGFAPVLLDEEDIQNQWDKINTGATCAALAWLRLCEDENLFRASRLPRVTYFYFAYFLVQVAKARAFAERLVDGACFDEIWVFDGAAPDYPAFSGNAYLNEALALIAAERKIAIKHLPVVSPTERKNKRVPLKARLKRAFEASYARFVRPEPARIAASGALRHIEAVVVETRRRGEATAILDVEFHTDQFFFAQRTGARYYVPACFDRARSADKLLEEGDMERAIVAAEGAKTFHFCGADLGSLIQKLILPGLEAYRRRLLPALERDAAALRALGSPALLLDEDFAPKGAPLAAAAARAGCDVYTVSHANLIVDFEIPAEQRIFVLSTTFVQSEHEKRMYEARGWDASHIEVTGTPRYDALMRPRLVSNAMPRRILFCPGVLYAHSPDHVGYAGLHVECYGGVQSPVFKAILKAAEECPVELIIKPHHAGLAGPYRDFIRAQGTSARVSVLDHRVDLSDLFMEADALIVTYWSTVIVEAALAGVPALFVRFRHAPSRALEEYAATGLVSVVRDQKSLEAEIDAISRKGRALFAERAVASSLDAYLGPRDGHAAWRVTARLLDAVAAGKRSVAESEAFS
jgi:hypothetical protein